MIDHSMATTTTKNVGESKNHLSSSLQDGSSAYRQAFYSQNSGEPDPDDANTSVFPIVFVAITVVVVLLRLLCCSFRKDADDGNQVAAGGGDRDPPSTTVSTVEVAPVQPPEPPVVCTYRKEDGWGESSCGVCLADLADGEALRVLPACLHYFHAACVNEWLHGHDTCPLCRAPLVVPGDAT